MCGCTGFCDCDTLGVAVGPAGPAGPPGPAGTGNFTIFDLGTIDITGNSIINVATATNTVFPANTLYGHVILTSTNATESVNVIANMPSSLTPVRFFVESGLIVNFVSGTSIPTNPRCSGGINVQVNGDFIEWIEFTLINGFVCQTNEGIYDI